MALALLLQDDSVFYIDSVERYERTKSSTVTSHPVDAKATISDHAYSNNQIITIKGVISSADFQIPTERSYDLLEEFSSAIDPQFRSETVEAQVRSNDGIMNLLPDSIRQLVEPFPSSFASMSPFKGYSHIAAKNILNRVKDENELLVILDYDYDTYSGRSVDTERIENCIIQSLSFSEDAKDSADALRFNMTLEQVTFTYILEGDVVNKNTTTDASKKKVDKGQQTNTDVSSDGNGGEHKKVYERLNDAAVSGIRKIFGD